MTFLNLCSQLTSRCTLLLTTPYTHNLKLKIKKIGIRIEWVMKKNYVTENCQHSLLAFCKAARAPRARRALRRAFWRETKI